AAHCKGNGRWMLQGNPACIVTAKGSRCAAMAPIDLCEGAFTKCRNWWHPTSARAGALEFRCKPDEGGLIAEPAGKVRADGRPGLVPAQRDRHSRIAGDVGDYRRVADARLALLVAGAE